MSAVSAAQWNGKTGGLRGVLPALAPFIGLLAIALFSPSSATTTGP
jgi:hypothetical protein